MNRLQLLGNCTNEDLVNEIFGSVSEFARLVEHHSNEFRYGKYQIKYNPETDIHSFWIKNKINDQIDNLLAETDALLASLADKSEKLNSSVGSVEAECDMSSEALYAPDL